MATSWTDTPGDASGLAQHLVWLSNAQRFANDLQGATRAPPSPEWAARMAVSWNRLLRARVPQQRTYQSMLNVVANWLQNGDDGSLPSPFLWDGATGPSQTYETLPFLALYFAMEVNSPERPTTGADLYGPFRDALARITPNEGSRWFYGQCIDNPELLKAYAHFMTTEIQALLDPNQGLAPGTETIGTLSVPNYLELQNYLVALDLPGQKTISDWLSTQKNPAWTDSSVPGQFVCNAVQVYRSFQDEAMRRFADWTGNYTNVVLKLAQWEKSGQTVALSGDEQGIENAIGPVLDLGFNEGIEAVRLGGKPIRAPKYVAAGDQTSAYPTLSWDIDDGNPFAATLYLGQVFDYTADSGWIGNIVWGGVKVPSSYGSDFFGLKLDFGGNDFAHVALVAKTKPANEKVEKTPWYRNEWLQLAGSFLGGWIAFKLMDFMWEKLKSRWSRGEKASPKSADTLKEISDEASRRVQDPQLKPPELPLEAQQDQAREFKQGSELQESFQQALEEPAEVNRDLIDGGGDPTNQQSPEYPSEDPNSTGNDPFEGNPDLPSDPTENPDERGEETGEEVGEEGRP